MNESILSIHSDIIKHNQILLDEFIKNNQHINGINRRRLIRGIGFNDANYKISYIGIYGQETCQYYLKWSDMIKRCYSEKYQEKQTTYKGCTVCNSWLIFSNFKYWMKLQNWKGLDLDKDIIKIGNKVYSPDTCCFISRRINCSLITCKSSLGKYPQGVSYHKPNDKFIAYLSFGEIQKNLGSFNTPEEASKTYNIAKSNYLIEISHLQTDERVRKGLLLHANVILNSHL